VEIGGLYKEGGVSEAIKGPEGMNEQEVLEILRETGAYLKGHFLLTSGLHSDAYIEKFRVLQHPNYAEMLCREIARRFEDERISVVIGPTTGGIIISYEVAKALGARAIFAEREDGRRTLRRGFRIEPGERTLVVEDVVTTGSSVRQVLQVVEESKGCIVGVGLLVDRTGGKIDFGVRTESLLRLPLEAYPPDECPLCKAGVPLARLGGDIAKF